VSVFGFMPFSKAQMPESKLDTIAAFYLLTKVSALTHLYFTFRHIRQCTNWDKRFISSIPVFVFNSPYYFPLYMSANHRIESLQVNTTKMTLLQLCILFIKSLVPNYIPTSILSLILDN